MLGPHTAGNIGLHAAQQIVDIILLNAVLFNNHPRTLRLDNQKMVQKRYFQWFGSLDMPCYPLNLRIKQRQHTNNEILFFKKQQGDLDLLESSNIEMFLRCSGSCHFDLFSTWT